MLQASRTETFFTRGNRQTTGCGLYALSIRLVAKHLIWNGRLSHSQTDEEVWAWYRQFSHTTPHEKPYTFKNYFEPVGIGEIDEFKAEFGTILPTIYETFLIEIGTGWLTADASGNITDTYDNCFLRPIEIAEILRKETVDWQIYSEFIDDDEVPFFRTGYESVHVFDRGSEAVHFPFLKKPHTADSFNALLSRLRVDCVFYTQLY